VVDWITNGARMLSRDEEIELAKQYQGGDSEAGAVLIRSQGAWILKRIGAFPRPSSVDVEDIVSELVVVLLKAFKRFDGTKSALSTFVTHVIDRRTTRIIHKLAGAGGGGDIDDIMDTIEDRPTLNENDSDTMEMHSIVLDICQNCLSPTTRRVLLNHMSGMTLAECAEELNSEAMRTSTNIHRVHAPPSVLSIIDGAIDIIKDELRARGFLKDGGDFQLKLFGGNL
jgi:RNA polymerase sigma factor (sigma-70 family)